MEYIATVMTPRPRADVITVPIYSMWHSEVCYNLYVQPSASSYFSHINVCNHDLEMKMISYRAFYLVGMYHPSLSHILHH